MAVLPGPQQRVLHEVLGPSRVLRQRQGETMQERHVLLQAPSDLGSELLIRAARESRFELSEQRDDPVRGRPRGAAIDVAQGGPEMKPDRGRKGGAGIT